ncbi:MAG: fatty acid desaturase [Deltaproteobacteria bacterium]|nr:fatty acid desaturase [Deltaproteobacteria bacterium]
MQIFRHSVDRLPVALFVGVFALDLSVFALASSWWVPIVWCAAMAIPKGWVCSWNHHHQHRPTFKKWLPNRLLELVFGFLTGVTSHTWFLHHVVGHHVNYLDQQKDESRWMRADGSTMGEFEYSFMTALTAYPRAWVVGRKYPRARRTFVRMGLLQLVLLGGLFALNPWNALWVFAVPMALSLYLTAWATYFHHAGLVTQDHNEASYNILHPLYNLATGNLGYHTAHHSQHGLHWSELPTLHAQLAESIPRHLYREPGIPFVWFGSEAKLEISEEEVERLKSEAA